MKFTADELETLQEQVCECEKEYDPSGAYSMVTAECLYCQLTNEIYRLMELTEADGKEIGSYINRTGLRGDFRIQQDKIIKQSDQLELAWGLIANSYGGNWELANDEWRGAAERWRDKYHDD